VHHAVENVVRFGVVGDHDDGLSTDLFQLDEASGGRCGVFRIEIARGPSAEESWAHYDRASDGHRAVLKRRVGRLVMKAFQQAAPLGNDIETVGSKPSPWMKRGDGNV